MFINTSGGILSSASNTIKSQLNFNNKQFGLFGTFFGVGRMLGGVVVMTFISSVNRKTLLFCAFFCKSILLFAMKLTKAGIILLGLRGGMGVFHVKIF